MKWTLLLLLLQLLLCVPCRASELDTELGAAAAEEALPESARDVFGDLTVDSSDPETALGRLAAYLREQLKSAVGEVLRPLAAVTAVTVLCAAARPLLGGSGFDYTGLCGALAVCAAAAGDLSSVLALGSRTLNELSDFSRALLPTLTAAAAAAGAPGSAAAKYAAGAMFSELMVTAANTLLFPLVCAFVGASAASCAFGGGTLDGAARLTGWAAKTALKALAAAFGIYLGMSGVVTAGADAAAVKAARAALSAALPVVGRTVADASDALVAGAGLLKAQLGVFGMLAALGILALPVLRLGLRCLLFRGAAAVLSAAAGDRIGKLLEAIASAYGLVLGLVGTAAVMLFLSVISLVRTVSG